MAELGFAAGVVGIAGFLGQATQGCAYLNNLIGNIKDAPREVRELQKEIDLLNTSVTKLQTIYEQISQSGAGLMITDPLEEIKQCAEAVATLTALLKPTLNAFDDGTTAKAVTGKRSWHRLKHALRKEKTKEKLDTLSRARLSLLAVQSSMELELLNHHTKSDQNISHSVFKLRESTAKTNHNLYNLERATEISTIILNETHEKTENALSEISRAKSVVEEVSTNAIETVNAVRKIECGMAGLRDHISATSQVSAQSNQQLTRDVLQQIDAGFSRQADAQDQAHPMLLAGIAQLLDAAFEKDREKHGESRGFMSESKTVMAKACSQTKDVGTSTAVSEQKDHLPPTSAKCCVKRYKTVSCTTYWTPFGSIIIRTLKPYRLLQDEGSDILLNAAPISIKKIEFRIKLGILNRSFKFTHTRRKHDPGSEMLIRTSNIVSSDGPAFKAAREWDLDAIRSMFENGEASIFDISEYGMTYFGECAFHLMPYKIRLSEPECLKFKAMVAYFINSGMKVEDGIWYFLDSVMHTIWQNTYALGEESILLDVVRELLSQMPYWDDMRELSPIYLDQHNLERPISQLLLRQGFFRLCPILEANGNVYLSENQRMMLLDPYGQTLKSIFESDKRSYYTIWIPGSRPYSYYGEGNLQALCQILDIYNQHRSPELRFCCLNRLVILLGHESDTQRLVWMLYEGRAYQRKPMTLAEFAARSDTTDLLEEALHVFGWSAFEIMNLYDEHLYYGIPELVDGKMWYQSRREFWDELKTGLYNGNNNTDDNWVLFHKLYQSDMFWEHLRDLFNISRDIFFSKEMKLPGDWPLEEEWTMSPSDKALLDEAIYKAEKEMVAFFGGPI